MHIHIRMYVFVCRDVASLQFLLLASPIVTSIDNARLMIDSSILQIDSNIGRLYMYSDPRRSVLVEYILSNSHEHLS